MSPRPAARWRKYPDWAMSTGVVRCHDHLVRSLLSGEGRTVCQVPPLAHRVGIGVVDGTGRGPPRPLKAAQR